MVIDGEQQNNPDVGYTFIMIQAINLEENLLPLLRSDQERQPGECYG